MHEQDYSKPRTNVYTMMLVLSFIFLCTAITLLGMELNDYKDGFFNSFMEWWKVSL